jgi:uncharacterized phiE125 gp8 family phage protein
MALRKITDATVEPITLAEAKAHMRIVSSADDTFITLLITTARTMCEERLKRSLLPTTWEMNIDAFPEAGYFILRRPRVISITSLKYIDTAGVLQTMSGSLYTLDDRKEPGYLVPAYNTSWPSTRAVPNAVTVTYVSGYADAAAVPTPIKQWLKVYVAEMYEQREATVIGPGLGILRIPYIDRLLDVYAVYR